MKLKGTEEEKLNQPKFEETIKFIYKVQEEVNQNTKSILLEHSHKAALGFPSFHLNDSFKAAFLSPLEGLELSDFLFSTEFIVDARQGKQLLGKIPQLSNIPSPLAELSPVVEEISSMNTGSFASLECP